MKKIIGTIILLMVTSVASANINNINDFDSVNEQAQMSPMRASPTINKGRRIYVSAMLGAAWLQNQDWDNRLLPLTLEFDPGINLGLSLGIKINSWRGELSVIGARNKLDNISGINGGYIYVGDPDLDTTQQATAFMINAIYDFNFNAKLVPYIGVGVGFISLDLESNDDDNIYFTKSSQALAYQGILGLGYQATDRLRIFVEYHHLASTRFNTSITYFGNQKLDYNSYYHNNLLSLGVTCFFNEF